MLVLWLVVLVVVVVRSFLLAFLRGVAAAAAAAGAGAGAHADASTDDELPPPAPLRPPPFRFPPLILLPHRYAKDRKLSPSERRARGLKAKPSAKKKSRPCDCFGSDVADLVDFGGATEVHVEPAAVRGVWCGVAWRGVVWFGVVWCGCGLRW